MVLDSVKNLFWDNILFDPINQFKVVGKNSFIERFYDILKLMLSGRYFLSSYNYYLSRTKTQMVITFVINKTGF